MSYCRWSSNDFDSDLYVWEDFTGVWIAAVASNRVAPVRPMPPPLDPFDADKWVERNREVTAILNDSPHHPIGLPRDGETRDFDTPGKCADWLEELRDLGYHVPDYAITSLREDDAEHTSQTNGDTP